jgi:hypothetical protein
MFRKTPLDEQHGPNVLSNLCAFAREFKLVFSVSPSLRGLSVDHASR